MAEKETGRIEAFSDGVFAVAITLLVLDLHVPALKEAARETPRALLHALEGQWPALAAYLVSFLTILIMWMNHHRLFEQVQKKDHGLLVFNGLLLMLVTLVPFPTALLSEYVRTPSAATAAAVYCGLNILMALAFNLLWNHAAHGGRLLFDGHDTHRIRHITQQYRFGPVLYLVAFALAFVSVPACLALVGALAVFFALPDHKAED